MGDFIGGIVVGVLGLVVVVCTWFMVSSEAMRARMAVRWEKIKLRVKFRRDPVECKICGGTGESHFPGTPLGPPSDGEEIQYDAPLLTSSCSRCWGRGIAYIYTYRLGLFEPNSWEQFEEDDLKVDTLLGGKSEPIRRKQTDT
jgi:hypothetical protein